MIIIRPRRRNALNAPVYRLRRVDIHALALDAPLPFLPTCAGMGLPWPPDFLARVRRLHTSLTDLVQALHTNGLRERLMRSALLTGAECQQLEDMLTELNAVLKDAEGKKDV